MFRRDTPPTSVSITSESESATFIWLEFRRRILCDISAGNKWEP